jgi:hypothetical protein
MCFHKTWQICHKNCLILVLFAHSKLGTLNSFTWDDNVCQNWKLRPSEVLCSVEWQSFTDISGQCIGPIFKGQEPIRCPETLVNNYHSTLHNTPEECSLINTVAEAWHHCNKIVWCTCVQAIPNLCYSYIQKGPAQVQFCPRWNYVVSTIYVYTRQSI